MDCTKLQREVDTHNQTFQQKKHKELNLMFLKSIHNKETFLPDIDIENHHGISFKKPILSALLDSYTVVDLHFHSRHSDGFNSIDAIAERARKLGIGIAVTDHNTIDGAAELSRHKDIFSIQGIEITAKEGAHVLVYFYSMKNLIDFYTTEISPWLGKNLMASCALSMESIISRARDYDGIVVFPHPYAAFTGVCNPIFSKRRQQSLFAMGDGVEVINGGNIHRWNLKAAELGLKFETGLTAGSDGHNLFQMGSAVTYANCKKDKKAFLDAIKRKETWTVGKEVGLLLKVTSNGMKFRTNINNTPDLFGKNVRYSYALIHSGSSRMRNHVYEKFDRKYRHQFLKKLNIL
ncbi:MAG TPA: PHP domain-containing protein [Desulfobacteraceae bacterium]|nr:PHP domain-containing protein [Desulfobacteraceae bacterium]